MLVNVAASASDWQSSDLIPDVADLTREFSRAYARSMMLSVLPSPLLVPTTTPWPASAAPVNMSNTTADVTTSWQAQSECVELTVKSAGFADGNFAEFYINDVRVELAPGRGLSVIVLEENGNVSEKHVFDTGFQASGSAPLAELLNGLPQGVGVLVASMDDASDNLTDLARTAIKSLGATRIDDLGYRGSYALIGVKGGPAVAETLAMTGDGPVQISGRNTWKPQCAETTTSESGQNSNDPLALRVRSAGFSDGNFVEFYVNGALVDLAPGRGLSMVALQRDGQVLEKHVFDTGFEGEGSGSLTLFLQGLSDGTVVLVASMDDATDSLTEDAKMAIRSLGATEIDNLGYRGSYALIGVKGSAAIAESIAATGNGPVDIAKTWIPGSLVYSFAVPAFMLGLYPPSLCQHENVVVKAPRLPARKTYQTLQPRPLPQDQVGSAVDAITAPLAIPSFSCQAPAHRPHLAGPQPLLPPFHPPDRQPVLALQKWRPHLCCGAHVCREFSRYCRRTQEVKQLAMDCKGPVFLFHG